MAATNDRDPVMDRLLSRALSASQAGASACVDAETMAAWVEQTLPSGAAASVEAHVSSCSRCQAVMATFVQSAPAPVPAESLWKRWHLGWFVPLAGTAAALMLYVASRPPVAPIQESVPSSVRITGESRPVAAPESTAPAPPISASQELGSSRLDAESARKSASASAAQAQANVARDAAAPAEPPRVQELQQRASSETAAQEARRAEAFAPAAPPSPTTPSPAVAAPLPTAPVFAPPAPAPPAPRAAGALTARTPATTPLEVRSVTATERWRIAVEGGVERSVDAGASWQATASVSAGIRAGSSPASGICWLVGSGGAVWVATDGVRFARLSFPQPVDSIAVAATSARSATVTAADGRLFHTDDQGTTWR